MLIDTHTHIYLPEFDNDRDELIARALEAGISLMILPNVDTDTIPMLYKSLARYPEHCRAAMGLHPEAVDSENLEERLEVVRKELEKDSKRFVAIGEVGLDLYWDKTFQKKQEEALRKQIEWAIAYDLPLILHSRQAVPEVVACLRDYADSSRLRGVFHSFTGSEDDLKLILSTLPTFMIGINGVVTFKKSHLSSLAPLIPLERLLLETDAPYLSPMPLRGRRNEPSHLSHTAAFVAKTINLHQSDLAKITSENAVRLFAL